MISEIEPYVTTVVSSLQKFQESQATAKQNVDRKVSADQSKKEMDENEKMRKLRESFEAMEYSQATIDRNM